MCHSPAACAKPSQNYPHLARVYGRPRGLRYCASGLGGRAQQRGIPHMNELTHEERLAAAMRYELEHGCDRRPAKYAALSLAVTLMSPRNTPWELVRAQGYLEGIRERIENAKVV